MRLCSFMSLAATPFGLAGEAEAATFQAGGLDADHQGQRTGRFGDVGRKGGEGYGTLDNGFHEGDFLLLIAAAGDDEALERAVRVLSLNQESYCREYRVY